MTTLYKGETIRNMTSHPDLGRFLARVREHTITIERTDDLVIAHVPFTSQYVADGTVSDEECMRQAVDSLLAQGWRLSREEAERDAEAEKQERLAGRLKLPQAAG